MRITCTFIPCLKRITINQKELTGLDPFLENHKKTTVSRMIDIAVKDSGGTVGRHEGRLHWGLLVA